MTPYLADTHALETERLILRAPQAGDVDAAIAFLTTDRSQFMGGPYTRHAAWRSVNHVIGHWVARGYGLFVFCEKSTGEPMGFVGPWYPEGWTEPELGWSIWNPAHEGQGYVHEAALAARTYAYDVLGWTTVISYIDHANARSIALATRLGAVLDSDAAMPTLDGWDSSETGVYRHPSHDTFAGGGMEAYA